jgi:cyclic pyranopterin phosphate synthase
MEENNLKNNLLKDFFGAFGDTGIFIPLALGMIIICGLSPTSVFLPAGLLYIIAGWYYKIPMPVQPLKAVAAISLVNALSPELIATTAYLMSALMALFLIFDFSKYLDKIFSKPIVRGIQFGLGILLIKSGLQLILNGEILAGVALPAVQFTGFSLGPNPVSIFVPSLNDVATAFVVLLIPQIPLTLGNSMVATADLAKDYFGEKAKRVNYKSLAGTIGLGNLFAGLVSGMPVCHGCGGLTAHYRFGARTARANLIIGFTFLIIALVFAKMSPYFLREIPLYFFGSALVLIGVFHSLLARDMTKAHDVVIVMAMGLVTLLYRNLTMALIAGLALREALNYRVYFNKLQSFSASIFNKERKTKMHNYASHQGGKDVVTPKHLLDSGKRVVTYLRIAVTEDRHLKPFYSAPELLPGKGFKKDLLTNAEIYRFSKNAVNLGIEKIRLTGGEPLLREGIVALIEKISSIPGLKELSLATDGILLENYALPLKRAGLKRINVTLDTLKEERFSGLSGGKDLTGVIRGIEEAKSAGLHVKANVIVLKGVNDDELGEFIQFSKEHEVTVRFIEYMPIVLNNKWKHYFISREEIVEKLSSLINSKVYPYGEQDAPSKYFHLVKGGEAGIISPVSHGLCHNCNRLQLTADGLLRGCLTQDTGIDLKTALRQSTSDKDISVLFERAISLKPEEGIYTLREETIGKKMSRKGKR